MYSRRGTVPHLTFEAALRHCAQHFGSQNAVCFLGHATDAHSRCCLNYRLFAQRVRRARQLLMRCGVRAGSCVALFGPNCPQWGVSYFAIVSLGARAVPLVPELSPQELRRCLQHAHVCCVIAGAAERETLAQADTLTDPDAASCSAKDGQDLSTVSHTAQRTLIALEDFSLVCTTDGVQNTPVPVTHWKNAGSDPDAIASVVYTSTGGAGTPPRAVTFTQRNLLCTARYAQRVLRARTHDVVFSLLPLAHLFEFVCAFLAVFFTGCLRVVCTSTPTDAVATAAIAMRKADVAFLSPTFSGGFRAAAFAPPLCSAAPYPTWRTAAPLGSLERRVQ